MCVFYKYYFSFFLLVAVIEVAFTQNLKRIDSLEQKLIQSDNRSKLDILNELFKSQNQFDYNVALGYASEFEKIAIEIGDSLKIVEGYRMIAYSMMDLGKNEEAVQNLLKALGIAERNKEASEDLKKQIKFILNNAGIATMHLGNYDKALEYHFKSLVYREEEKDQKSICTALNNIGLVFYKLNDPNKAIEYYSRALEIKKTINDKNDLDRIMINLGLCFNQEGAYEKAIEYFNQGFGVCGIDCSENIKREGFLGLGIAYLGIKNSDEAKNNLLKSLEISKKQNNLRYQCDNLYQLSLVEYSEQNISKSLEYLKEAETFAKSSVQSLILIYKQFSLIYGDNSDYIQSNIYLNKYVQLKDSIYSDELIKNLAKVQTNYAERENIKTINKQNDILELKDEILGKQRIITLLAVAITILLLSFTYFAIQSGRNYSAKLKKHNTELEEKVLERTQDLKKANQLLKKAKGDLDNFLYKTSHDIRGPLATIKGLNNLNMDSAQDVNMTKDLLDKKNTQIDKLIRILSRINIVTNISKTVLQAEIIDFKKMINDIIEFERKNGQLKNIQVTTEIQPGLRMTSDATLIRLILENMIDNSLKFFNDSQRIEPFVKISVTSVGSDAMIRVQDNGVGIAVKPHEDVFSIFMRGSEKSETGGVGLYLCKVCTDKLQSEIKLEQTDKNGTTFLIRTPLDATRLINDINQATRDEMAAEAKDSEATAV